MNERWVSVHPFVLAMTACAAAAAERNGARFSGTIHDVAALRYLIRMKLFNHVAIDPGRSIVEHEESGRFIPLTQIFTADDLRETITNLVPLLHAPPEVADPIRYVFSEMGRNALEHSQSPVGAFVCAQYYKKTNRVSIGIADAGLGILGTMARYHRVNNSREAIRLAMQPGITGTTARIGGTEFNAGAGLFFIKSIAALSRNYFVLYSGNTAFQLLKAPVRKKPELHIDPERDHHNMHVDLPPWRGTVVGIDLSVSTAADFAQLLDEIRKAYAIDVKHKKKYARKIRFSR